MTPGAERRIARRWAATAIAAERRIVSSSALVEAHVVQQVIQRHELLRGVQAMLGLGPKAIHPADDPLVELRVQAHRVVHARAALEEPGQDLVDVPDRERVGGAMAGDGTLGAGTLAVPELLERIPVAAEEHVVPLRALRDQDRDRLRLREPGQELEVAVLAVGIVRIAVATTYGCGGKDRDRVSPHHPHQLAPAADELVTFQGRPQRARCSTRSS
jgi:hypothetical protein